MDKQTYKDYKALKEKVEAGTANFKERNLWKIIQEKSKKDKKQVFVAKQKQVKKQHWDVVKSHAKCEECDHFILNEDCKEENWDIVDGKAQPVCFKAKQQQEISISELPLDERYQQLYKVWDLKKEQFLTLK